MKTEFVVSSHNKYDEFIENDDILTNCCNLAHYNNEMKGNYIALEIYFCIKDLIEKDFFYNLRNCF